MVTLRPLAAADYDYFAKWWRDPELIAVTSGDFAPLSDDVARQYFEAILTAERDVHRMIEVGGDVIGHVALSLRPDGWYEAQIVIGQRAAQDLGHGRQALKLILNEAAFLGAHGVYVNVRPNNARAIKAYTSVGFAKVGDVYATNNSLQPYLVRMELRFG